MPTHYFNCFPIKRRKRSNSSSSDSQGKNSQETNRRKRSRRLTSSSSPTPLKGDGVGVDVAEEESTKSSREEEDIITTKPAKPVAPLIIRVEEEETHDDDAVITKSPLTPTRTAQLSPRASSQLLQSLPLTRTNSSISASVCHNRSRKKNRGIAKRRRVKNTKKSVSSGTSRWKTWIVRLRKKIWPETLTRSPVTHASLRPNALVPGKRFSFLRISRPSWSTGSINVMNGGIDKDAASVGQDEGNNQYQENDVDGTSDYFNAYDDEQYLTEHQHPRSISLPTPFRQSTADKDVTTSTVTTIKTASSTPTATIKGELFNQMAEHPVSSSSSPTKYVDFNAELVIHNADSDSSPDEDETKSSLVEQFAAIPRRSSEPEVLMKKGRFTIVRESTCSTSVPFQIDPVRASIASTETTTSSLSPSGTPFTQPSRSSSSSSLPASTPTKPHRDSVRSIKSANHQDLRPLSTPSRSLEDIVTSQINTLPQSAPTPPPPVYNNPLVNKHTTMPQLYESSKSSPQLGRIPSVLPPSQLSHKSSFASSITSVSTSITVSTPSGRRFEVENSSASSTTGSYFPSMESSSSSTTAGSSAMNDSPSGSLRNKRRFIVETIG